MRNREAAQTQSKLDTVSAETAAILSLLRRYQALAQAQTAENRLMATLGLEPRIGSTGELSLKDLTEQLRKASNVWAPLAEAATAQPAAVQAAAGAESAPATRKVAAGQW